MRGVRYLVVSLLLVTLCVYLYFVVSGFLLGFRGDSEESTMPVLDFDGALNVAKGCVYAVMAAVAVVVVAVLTRRRKRIFGTLSIDELTEHLIILGPTGSGKTNIAKRIVASVKKNSDVSVAVLDWHNEYSDVLRGARIVRSINPFALPCDVSAEEHAVVVTSMLHDVLRLSEPQAHLLYRSLIAEYSSRKSRSEPPTVNDILERIDTAAPISRFDYEVKVAVERRLLPLTFGGMEGEQLPSDGDVVVDLSCAKTYEERVLTCLIVLYQIYNVSTKTPIKQPPKLRRLLVVEEAHNAIPPRRLEDPSTIGERLVLELRKHGTGVVLLTHDYALVPFSVVVDAGALALLSEVNVPPRYEHLLPEWRNGHLRRRKMSGKLLLIHRGRLKVTAKPKPLRTQAASKSTTISENKEPLTTKEEKIDATSTPSSKTAEGVDNIVCAVCGNTVKRVEALAVGDRFVCHECYYWDLVERDAEDFDGSRSCIG